MLSNKRTIKRTTVSGPERSPQGEETLNPPTNSSPPAWQQTHVASPASPKADAQLPLVVGVFPNLVQHPLSDFLDCADAVHSAEQTAVVVEDR